MLHTESSVLVETTHCQNECTTSATNYLSDASTDAPCPSGLRLGVVLYEQDPNFVPLCSSFDVPLEVVHSWHDRATYITQAELLILPVMTYMAEFRSLLANGDLI